MQSEKVILRKIYLRRRNKPAKLFQFINLLSGRDNKIIESSAHYLFSFVGQKGVNEEHRRPGSTAGCRLKTNGDRVFAEKLRKLGVRLAIGDHPVELSQWPDAGGFGFAEFTVVGHQDFLL